MSEREVFELNDDGEPPSITDKSVDAFHISEHWPRVNYETGETYDARFSEYIAIRALTADAEVLIRESGVLYGDDHIDSDVSVIKEHTRLRRRTSIWFDQDQEGQKVPVKSYAYFYSEQLPDGKTYIRSWDDTSIAIHRSVEDHVVESVENIHNRMLYNLGHRAEVPKMQFGRKVLKHIFHRSRS